MDELVRQLVVTLGPPGVLLFMVVLIWRDQNRKVPVEGIRINGNGSPKVINMSVAEHQAIVSACVTNSMMNQVTPILQQHGEILKLMQTQSVTQTLLMGEVKSLIAEVKTLMGYLIDDLRRRTA